MSAETVFTVGELVDITIRGGRVIATDTLIYAGGRTTPGLHVEVVDGDLKARVFIPIEFGQAITIEREPVQCWRPGDQEHDHAMCEDVAAEQAEAGTADAR